MLAAALLLQAAIAAPIFAPPLDAPLLVTTEQISISGTSERRYTLRRLIRFRREGAGYRAEVRVLHPQTDASAGVGGMIEAGFAALTGHTLVFHLDGAGRVTQVEEMAALWTRLCDAIGAVAGDKARDPATRAALADRVATPLRGLADERRRIMLSTLVTAVIDDEPRVAAGSTTPVRIPGKSPLGTTQMLEGVRTTTADRGEVQSVTRASTAAGPDGDGSRIELERTRRLDPRTGLLSFASDTNRIVTGERNAARQTVRTTIVRLEPAGTGAWPKS